MKTKVYELNEKNLDIQAIKEAAEVIRKNGTVVFPTETVYGLGANALSSDAAKAIFNAKGRPSDNPLIVHISSMDMLLYVIGEPLSHKAKTLMEKFWPGPLTLIFKKSSAVPLAVTAGLDTVAVRMPDNEIALELIKQSGLPIAAPSANISGKPSPTKAEHVVGDLMGRVDVIIGGSSSRVGLESTVLDLTGAVPVILRPGGITLEELQEAVGEVHIDKGLISKEATPKAPGMKYTHYAPEGDMIIIKGDMPIVVDTIQRLTEEQKSLGKSVGILATDETKQHYHADVVLSVGSRDNLYTAAAAIFDALREFDKQKADIIYAEALSEENIGMAVMNRLKKAAGFNIIEV